MLKQPTLKDYGLENIVDIHAFEVSVLQEQREKTEKYVKTMYVYALGIGFFVMAALAYFCGDGFGGAIAMGLIEGIPVGLFILLFLNPDKRAKNKIHVAGEEKLNAINEYKVAVSEYNHQMHLMKVQYWQNLDGFTFEKEVCYLFNSNGYKALLTKSGADGGVDIIMFKGNERIAVQCKAHKSKVSEGVARDLYGVLHSSGYDRGVIVSLNGFSKNVVSFCDGLKTKPIELLDVNDLIRMQRAL